MEPITFGIAIVAIVAFQSIKSGVVDGMYAARGKTSPRMKMRMRQLEAAIANGGKPVRYGFGGYMSDLIDDGWQAARQRRIDKLATGEGPRKEKGPLKRYFGHVWEDRWDAASRKHDRNYHARCVKKGLRDPDEPVNRGNLDDTFDTVPRDTATDSNETTVPRFDPRDEGDYRFDSNAGFSSDDLRRFGMWAKTQLPEERHDEVDQWLARGVRPHEYNRLHDVRDDLHRWLTGKHLYLPEDEKIAAERDRRRQTVDFLSGDEWAYARMSSQPDKQAARDWLGTYRVADVDRLFDGWLKQHEEQTEQQQQREDIKVLNQKTDMLFGVLLNQMTGKALNQAIQDRANAAGISADPDSPERQAFMQKEGAAWGHVAMHLKDRYPDTWQKELGLWALSGREPVVLDAQPITPDPQKTAGASTGGATVIPINRNRKDNPMTNGEILSYEQAQAFATEFAKAMPTAKADWDAAVASLQVSGFEGNPVNIANQILGHFDAIVGLSEEFANEFEAQADHADSHHSAAGRGTRLADTEFYQN